MQSSEITLAPARVTIISADFDNDGYERLLERNEHYNKTIREK